MQPLHEKNSGSSRTRRLWRWFGAAVCAALVAGSLGTAATPTLLLVLRPRRDEVVGVGGVEVMVRFSAGRRVDPDSLQVRLNGADVTGELTRGANGAVGRLFGVLEGGNVLEVEVFGDRGGIPSRLLADQREIRFRVRLPQDANRA